MFSLRTKIVQAFIAVMAVLLLSNILFGVMHFYTVGLYQRDVAKLTDDYRLLEYTSNLVDSFNLLFKDVNNQESLNQYNSLHAQLLAVIQREDSLGSNGASYVGLKNTVLEVVKYTDQAVALVKSGDISQASGLYTDATKTYEFVKQNATVLFVDDLKTLASTQTQVEGLNMSSIYVGIILVVVIFIAGLIYALYLARKIVGPLEKLTNITEEIAQNNLEVSIPKELFNSKDELARLAVSFSTMTKNLKDTMAKISQSNLEINAAKESLEIKNTELEKFNKLMVDRELKMIELKKEIQLLKKLQK